MKGRSENKQERISELFIGALEVASNQWKAWIDSHCTPEEKSEGIDTQILKLLKSSARADAFFEALNKNIENDLDGQDNSIPYKPGDIFEKYKIIGELGHGGMASVFLCERIDGQFDQKVALKVMKVKGEFDFLMDKFRQEQQILAGINHPNIAQLYDGGVSKEGYPYMIMEYVEGESIDKYCERIKPDLKQKLKLFLQVCDALQYAHNNFIVHHDIKPANILVNEAGHVKLLDFGISQIIHEQEKTLKSNETFTGTLQYAAPEQFKGLGPTVASDIYKLGLVLFKLVTGENFYDVKFIEPKDSGTTNHEKYKSYLINKTLQGRQSSLILCDLSAIFEKSLAENPLSRFITVNSFSHDIHNLLENKPLHSHYPSWKYKLKKGLSRNRSKIRFLMVFGILFLTAVGFFIAQYFETVQENERAEQILGFINEIFDSVDPVQTAGETLTALDLFEKSAERIESLEGQPDLQSELFLLTGSLISRLGEWEQSVEFYSKALEYLPAKNDRATRLQKATIFQHLSAGYLNISNYILADSLIDKAIDYYESVGSKGRKYIPDAFVEKGNILRFKGEYDDALSIIQKSIEIFKVKNSESQPELVKALNAKASCLREMEELSRALEAQQSAYDKIMPLKDDHLDLYLGTLNNLAMLQQRSADYDGALETSKKVLSEYEKIYGPDNPRTIRALNNLGTVYHSMQEQEKADSVYALVYEKFNEILGPTHQYTVSSLFNLATSLYRQEKFEEVLPLYYRVLEADIVTLGEDHHFVGSDYIQLANVYMNLENWEQSEKYLRKGERIYKQQFGESHASISRLYYFFGQLFGRKGDAKTAIDYLNRSVDMARIHLGEDHQNTKRYQESLAAFEEKFSQLTTK